jgi:hypothetical protein
MTLAKFALAAALFAAAGAANAFTYDSRTIQSPEAQARLMGGASNSHSPHFSFSVNGGNPNGAQSGIDGRFLPSANPAFQSPFSGPNNLDLALSRH